MMLDLPNAENSLGGKKYFHQKESGTKPHVIVKESTILMGKNILKKKLINFMQMSILQINTSKEPSHEPRN